MKFIHREGTQLAVYIQVKDLYHEFSNNYSGQMPDLVRLSFKFKEEFLLIEDLYLRYTNTEIVKFFMKAKYVLDYDRMSKMTERSYQKWRAYYYGRINTLKEAGATDSSKEICDIKYMMNEAEIIRSHPDRLKFPSHEIYPMFEMA